MNALSALKQAMRDGVELTDPQEVYALGIPPNVWPKIIVKLGIEASPQSVKAVGVGKCLQVIKKTLDGLLGLKDKYAEETVVGNEFSKDIIPAGFPFSSIQRLRDDIEKELLSRRAIIIEALTLIAKDEVGEELAKAQEAKHYQAIPEMRQPKTRKTLAWHRFQARKKGEDDGSAKSQMR